jgi:hypothetical protein
MYYLLSEKIIRISRNEEQLSYIQRPQKPTFREFVQFVIEENEKGNKPDMHWAPVYSFCNPCQV